MPRCSCAGSTCGCKVQGGAGITVTGRGTADDPYIVVATVANIEELTTFVDSATLEWTVVGDGTAASPLVIEGNVPRQNFPVYPSGGAPDPAIWGEGAFYYDTTDDTPKWSNGTVWAAPAAAAGAGRNWWPNVWGLPGVQLRDGVSNETANANTIYLDPFKVDAPGTLNGLAIHVQTAGSGDARLGVWKKDSTGDTWARVAEAGTVSIASTGEKTLTGLSIALATPGLYATSVLPSSNITLVTKPSDSTVIGLGSNGPFNSNLATHVSTALTYGALPSTLTAAPQGGFGGTFHRVMARLS